jgi:Dolichyl-phosphate-mannose-protein mannosyltransferase
MTPIPHLIKKLTPIAWVLLIAFSIRLLLPLIAFIFTKELGIFYGGDTPSYLVPAKELLRSGRYMTGGFPEIFRAPGYSLLLMPGIILNRLELVMVAMQIVFSCLTVYLVFKIALIVFNNNKIAIICAWLYALEPLSIVYPGKILTETAFTTFLMAFLYCFLVYLNKRSLILLLASAVILVAAAYIRPIAYYLPLLFTLILIIVAIAKFTNKKTILIHALIFFSISMGSMYLWNIRNKIVAGYSGFSSVTEVNLYYWHAAAVLTAKPGTNFHGQQAMLREQLQKALPPEAFQGNNIAHICACAPDYGSPTVLKYMGDEAKKILFSHPLSYLKLRLNGMINLLFNSTPWPYLTLLNFYKIGGFTEIANAYETEFFRNGWLAGMSYYLNKTPAAVSITWLILQINLLIYWVLTFVALPSKFFVKNTPALILLTVASYFVIITGGPEGGSSRYRHPVMPIICILAGYGLYFIIEKFKQKFN